jgi:hypothetical protein
LRRGVRRAVWRRLQRRSTAARGSERERIRPAGSFWRRAARWRFLRIFSAHLSSLFFPPNSSSQASAATSRSKQCARRGGAVSRNSAACIAPATVLTPRRPPPTKHSGEPAERAPPLTPDRYATRRRPLDLVGGASLTVRLLRGSHDHLLLLSVRHIGTAPKQARREDQRTASSNSLITQ